MRFKLLVSIFCTFYLWFPGNINAQNSRISDPNNHAWFMYFGDHKIIKNWGLHTEAQIRRAKLGKTWQQLLLRTGINYDLTQNAMATLGYCFVETYPYGDFPVAEAFPEHRIYEQLQLKNTEGNFALLHRFRQEQRFVIPPGKDSSVYSNRTRYMFKAALPLSKKTEETNKIYQPNGLYLAAYDEIFVSFGKNVQQNIFDQNRLYFALGYKMNNVAFEAGYLNQVVQKANGKVFEYNHTLQFGITYNLDFRPQK